MLRRSVPAVHAVVSILRAAIRVAWLEPQTTLPELVARLRNAPTTTSPLRSPFLIDPSLSLRLLEAMLPILPPFGVGRCLKRSLLLLDLWSRAGLAPSLHLGVRTLDSGAGCGDRGGHAWVETASTGFRTFHSPDVIEAWRA
jgi:Transglutaminase-like superfamily